MKDNEENDNGNRYVKGRGLGSVSNVPSQLNNEVRGSSAPFDSL
jgi:hypothetical protein